MKYDLDLIATPTVRLVKHYVKALDLGRMSTDDVAKELLQLLDSKRDDITPFMVHLVLFLHLNHPEVEDILDNQDLFPLVPFYTNKGIRTCDYSELISKLRLHQDFMHMVTALHQKEIAKELLNSTLPMFCLQLKNGLLDNWDDLEMYLFALADPSLHEVNNNFYFNFFSDLLHSYVSEQNIKKQHKLATLFKLLAYICMTPEDYSGSSKIAELNINWCFTPSKKVAYNGMVVFLAVYHLDLPNNDKRYVDLLLQDLVYILLSEIDTTLSVKDGDLFICGEERCNLAEMSWKEYVGGCAYFAELLLQKYEQEIVTTGIIEQSFVARLLIKVKDYARFKPKLKSEYFRDDINSFKSYCSLIREHCITSYQEQLLFLEFVRSPGSMGSDALQVIETIVPKANMEVAVELITTVSEFIIKADEKKRDEEELFMERLKDVILSLLKSETLMEQRNELMKTIFQDGIHNNFEKQNLVHFLCSFRQTHVRAMSNMTAIELKDYGNEIYVAAVQNPILTVMTIVAACVRTQRCASLQEVKSFLDLSIGSANSDTQMPPETTVLELALYKLMLGFYESDIHWHFFNNGLPILIENLFIECSTLLILLKKLIKQFIKYEALENMMKVVNIFKVIFKFSLEKDNVEAEELKEHKTFFTIIYRLTTMFASNQDMLTLREDAIRILLLIQDKLDILEPNPMPVKFETNLQKVNGERTSELGLIYIRYPNLRSYVLEKMIEESVNPKWSNVDGYNELTNVVISLVMSTCRLEWQALALFIIKVLCPHKLIINRVGLHYFMNRVVAKAFQARTIRTSMFLEFYRTYLEVLKVDEEEKFAATSKDQLAVVKLLVSLFIGLYSPTNNAEKETEYWKLNYHQLHKKSRLAQKIMLMLNNLVDWVHEKKILYPKEVKEEVCHTLSLIPKLFGEADNSSPMINYKQIMKTLSEILT